MEKIINIPQVDELTFFESYLEILSSFKPISQLRGKERTLLAVLMYYNNKYKSIDRVDRNKIIFNTDTREEMRTILGCTPGTFNNNMSVLRKHKILNGENELGDTYIVYPDKVNTIKFVIPLK